MNLPVRTLRGACFSSLDSLCQELGVEETRWFEHIRFEQTVFAGVVFDGISIYFSEFQDCIFEGCQFEQHCMLHFSQLNRCRFEGCRFDKSHLSRDVFSSVEFVNTRFRSLALGHGLWSGTALHGCSEDGASVFSSLLLGGVEQQLAPLILHPDNWIESAAQPEAGIPGWAELWKRTLITKVPWRQPMALATESDVAYLGRARDHLSGLDIETQEVSGRLSVFQKVPGHTLTGIAGIAGRYRYALTFWSEERVAQAAVPQEP